MIGFNRLGQIGRLGNQMFNYAALFGIAKLHNYKFIIPDHSMHKDFGGYKYHELQHCFKITPDGYGIIEGTEYDIGFATKLYDENYVKKCPDNVSILGHFESEKYFKHVEQAIRKQYEFKDDIQEYCKSFKINKANAIIVRRGDFIHQQHIKPLSTIEYYKKAIAILPKNIIKLVFSDDIEWCKEQDIFKDCFFCEYSNIPFHKSYIDLCLMSQCDNFVITNSTFAWWGAWLSKNPNKIVIAPSNWFGPDVPNHTQTQDLYCDGWIII